MADETGGTSAPSPAENTGGIATSDVQGAIPVRMDPNANAKLDAPYPRSPEAEAAMSKWLGNAPKTAEQQRAEQAQSIAAKAAENAVQPATTIPVTVPAATPDPYINTADLNTPSPELLEMARNFAPVLEQFKQQGFTNADALTRAQTEFQLKQTIESEQSKLFAQYDAAVNDPNNPMDPQIAERLFLAESRALESTHRANHIMQQAAQQTQTAMLQQVRTQYPRLPAETITAVMGALPGEAGANLLASMAQQIDATLQAEMTRQATQQAAAQATAAARAAGAAGSAPGPGADKPRQAGVFSWMDSIRNLPIHGRS